MNFCDRMRENHGDFVEFDGDLDEMSGRNVWKRYLLEMKIAMRAEMFCEWKQLGAVR